MITGHNNKRDALTTEPSMVVVAIRKLLLIANRILPGGTYDYFYSSLFGIYKWLFRLLFIRFIFKYAVTRDKTNLTKMQRIYRVLPYSLVGWRGLSATYDVVKDVEERAIEGSIVECGVAKGGSAALMAIVSQSYNRNRKVWLFDSFEGLPSPTKDDFTVNNGASVTGTHVRPLDQGSCLGTREEVSDLLFDRFQLSDTDISLVEGWFEDTMPGCIASANPIAVLRIDADWYESVKTCLENLYDRVVPNGYVIIDDYGTCIGAKLALDEFLADRDSVDLVPDGRGGVLFSKSTIHR